jgi:hypothetical protein
MISKNRLTTLIFSFVIIANGLQAQTISYNQEFPIAPIQSASTSEAVSAPLKAGGFVVAWDGNDGGGNGVLGQIFDAYCQKKGNKFRADSNIFNDSQEPSILCLSDGKFLICWNRNNYGGFYCQIFNSDGSKSGSHVCIRYDCRGKVVDTINDGFLVLMMNSRNEIYVQIFNNSAYPVTLPLLVNNPGANIFSYPKACVLDNDNFIVCWSVSSDQQNSYVGQIFNAQGEKINSEHELVNLKQSYSSQFDLMNSPDGGFLFCWTVFNDSQYDTNFQLYNADGEKEQIHFKMNPFHSLYSDQLSIKRLQNRGFILLWTSWDRSGDGGEIYAQLYDNNYNILGSEFLVNETRTGNQYLEDVVILDDGRIFTLWTSYNQFSCISGKYYLANYLNHKLREFSLLKPQNELEIGNTTTEFVWESASRIRTNFPWELEYYLYLKNANSQNMAQITYPIQDTTLVLENLEKSETYYWEILARNHEGDSLWCAEPFQFFIKADGSASIIQNAIDSAHTGDTILITPGNSSGNFLGNLSITKSITLKASINDSITIYGTENGHPTVAINSDLVTLENIWITGKKSTENKGNEALVITNSNRVTLNNCSLNGGEAEISEASGPASAGDALLLSNSGNIEITNCRLTGGSAFYKTGTDIASKSSDGGNGIIFANSQNIKIKQTSITGGNGSDAISGAGKGGLGVHILNSIDIDISSCVINSGNKGWNSSDNPQYPTGNGSPALKIYSSDSLIISNSQLTASPGNNNGFGIQVESAVSYFKINSTIIQGYGSYGHGIYSKKSKIHISGSEITGGTGYGKDGQSGDGIHALNSSFILLDKDAIVKGGPKYALGMAGDSVFYDTTSMVVRNTGKPKAVSLLLPADQDTIKTFPVIFSWTKSYIYGHTDTISYIFSLYHGEKIVFETEIQDTFIVFDKTGFFQNNKLYYWNVKAAHDLDTTLNNKGMYTFSTLLENEFLLVDKFCLYHNYPNPFNQQTTIKYTLPVSDNVFDTSILIYTVLGQLVFKKIYQNQSPGIHRFIWDGVNRLHLSLPSGVYYCQVQAGKYKAVQKMLLVR